MYGSGFQYPPPGYFYPPMAESPVKRDPTLAELLDAKRALGDYEDKLKNDIKKREHEDKEKDKGHKKATASEKRELALLLLVLYPILGFPMFAMLLYSFRVMTDAILK